MLCLPVFETNSDSRKSLVLLKHNIYWNEEELYLPYCRLILGHHWGNLSKPYYVSFTVSVTLNFINLLLAFTLDVFSLIVFMYGS